MDKIASVSFSIFMQILMPVFPGQLRYIRKNLFHAVYVLDPATICGLEASFVSNIFYFLILVYLVGDLFNVFIFFESFLLLHSCSLLT